MSIRLFIKNRVSHNLFSSQEEQRYKHRKVEKDEVELSSSMSQVFFSLNLMDESATIRYIGSWKSN